MSIIRKITTKFPSTQYSQSSLASTLQSYCEKLLPSFPYTPQLLSCFQHTRIQSRRFIFPPDNIYKALIPYTSKINTTNTTIEATNAQALVALSNLSKECIEHSFQELSLKPSSILYFTNVKRGSWAGLH